MHPSRCWNRRNYWSGLSTKKVLMSLSNFALKSVSVSSFTKSVFQCRRGLVQMKWGLEQKYMHPSRYWNSRTYWSGLSTKKKYSCRCQILRSKECRYAVSQKVFFNLVKDLFKWNEGWSRSVSILIGSEAEGIIDLVVYEKKYSCLCQILRSKSVGMQFHEKCFSM